MIRPMRDSDVPILRAMYEQRGLERKFPDVIAAARVFDVDGVPVAMVGAEIVAELVLVIDPAFDTPGGRASILRDLYGEIAGELRCRGVMRGVAWVHDNVKRHFVRRLLKELKGWQQVPETALFGELGVRHE